VLASLTIQAQEYYPEGTKWTEIRLDTLKYDSWYSKVGDEWVPNFETIEYYVKGVYTTEYGEKYKCVYTNGPEWTDSLTLLLQEEGESDNVGHDCVMVSVPIQYYDWNDNLTIGALCPGTAYQFDWSVGKGIYFEDIMYSNTTGIPRYYCYYGIIDEIKEDYFGGVRPLKYVDLDGKAPECGKWDNPQKVDTQGGRIIQGIGITEWNDGECLFGPPNPYSASGGEYQSRHYRSMLVHFERNGEVLYDVWPDSIPQKPYRPFIEEGKLWVVRGFSDGYGITTDETWTGYCYFDGDTIVDGRTCKQMKKIWNANEENWVNGVFTPANSFQEYVGAWYEQDKKVYFANYLQDHLELFYDFTLCTNDSIDPLGGFPLVVNKVSGGFPGFKGTYYDFWHEGQLVNRWLEGVGSDSWPDWNHPWAMDGGSGGLLSCRIGDEVIYYNSAVEDPYDMNAPKRRFDFTHTTKSQPKSPRRSEEGQSLYGEYNNLLLDINLDPLSEAYLVRITDETGKVVYEKAINAGSIVALNIDISAYAAGRYTVTVENSQEAFTGEFEAQTTGIEEVRSKRLELKDCIYNLQGQRLNTLQRGLNIVNGKKVYVK